MLPLFDFYKDKWNWFPVERFYLNEDMVAEFVGLVTKAGLTVEFKPGADNDGQQVNIDIADVPPRTESLSL